MLIAINTRIGWPWIYWHHGAGQFLGYLMMYLLIGIGVCVLLRIDDLRGRGCGRMAVGLLVAAGLLLQMLPHARTGVEVLPSLPWHYTNWIAGTASLVCWCCLLGMGVFAIDPSPEDESAVSGFALGGLVLTAILSPWVLDVPAKSPVVGAANHDSQDLDHYHGLVNAWRGKRSAAEHVLERIETDRQRLASSPKASSPIITAELADLDAQIATTKKEIDRLDRTIITVESMLRRLERRRMIQTEVRMSAEEREELVRAEAELGDLADISRRW